MKVGWKVGDKFMVIQNTSFADDSLIGKVRSVIELDFDENEGKYYVYDGEWYWEYSDIRPLEENDNKVNTERIMKVLADELGVEFGERFEIEGCDNKFYFGEVFLMEIKNNEETVEVTSKLLKKLINGECCLIKTNWKPKHNQYYYTISFAEKDCVSECVWLDMAHDERRLERGVVFKTREDALEKVKEMGMI